MTFQKYKPLIVVFFIFLYMFFVNLLTPIFADDYNYSFMWDKSKRIETIMDVIRSQYMHYMEWGGRTVAHSIGQILLMLNPYIQSLLNAFVFIVLIYFIYWHSQGKRLTVQSNAFIVLLITFFCWMSLPNFGETNIWIIGAVNYLWTTVIILAFLLPYRLRLISSLTLKENNLAKIGMFLLGVVAGWTNENTALSAIVLTFVFIIYYFRKKLIQTWMVMGFVGAIIGYAFMIFAPGNMERSSLIERAEDYSFLLYHIKIPLATTIKIMMFQTPVWITFLIFISIIISYCFKNQCNLKEFYQKHSIELNYTLVLVGLSIANNLIMFASPSFPIRAGFGSSVFLIIGVLNMLRIDCIKEMHWEKKKTLQFAISFFLVVSMGMVLERYIQLSQEHDSRLEFINNSKQKGEYFIKLQPYSIEFSNSLESYYGHVFVSDIGENPKVWPNNIFAEYHGLKSVQVEK